MSGKSKSSSNWIARIPLALVLFVVIQTGSAIWWAAMTESRLDAMESWAALANRHHDNNLVIGERLARIEATLEQIESRLNRRPHGSTYDFPLNDWKSRKQ